MAWVWGVGGTHSNVIQGCTLALAEGKRGAR